MNYSSLLVLLFTLLSIPSIGQNNRSNKIDQLNSLEEISAFIDSIGVKQLEGDRFILQSTLSFEDSACQRLADSLKTKNFYKADIDNNGYTDLIVTGILKNKYSTQYHAVLCVLDSANNHFLMNKLTRRHYEDCSFPQIVTEKNINYLDYYTLEEHSDSLLKTKKTRLVYKYGDFIEYNRAHKNRNISSISYHYMHGWINANYVIYIKADRSVLIEGKKTFMTVEDYTELIALLNYMDFKSLKERYSVNWTDSGVLYFKIEYGRNKNKLIKDYGSMGTFGLQRVYAIIEKYNPE